MTEALADAAYHAPYSLVALATTLWFAAIYTAIAGGAYWLAVAREPLAAPEPRARVARMRNGQVREELLLSVLSILIFAAQSVGMVWLLRAGILHISFDRPVYHLAWELPVLYLWNELHFYAVHRLLHWRPLYRRVHIWHHRSVVTTPFSAYCFHPVESFLLGTVMVFALAMHAFSFWGVLGLTIMSLLLNVGGHLPHERIRPAFAFAAAHSRYHNLHHRSFQAPFGFSLPLLDRWLSGRGSRPPAVPPHA